MRGNQYVNGGGQRSLDRAISQAERLTRRSVLTRGAGVALSSTLAGRALLSPGPVLARTVSRGPIPLPTPEQVRAEFARMVEFGPRLTASDPHTRYIDWLEQEFIDAGLRMLPRDNYTTDRWLAQQVGLEILTGASAGPVKVGAYYPRSQQTPATGVSGPLVYGGTAPVPSVSITNPADLQGSLARYPADLSSWSRGLQGVVGGLQATKLDPVPASTLRQGDPTLGASAPSA